MADKRRALEAERVLHSLREAIRFTMANAAIKLTTVMFAMLTSPLTIWAQTLRMRLVPPELRGRIFSLLRTTMQAAEPIGGALGGAVIATGGLVLVLAGIATAIGAPGLVGMAHPALAPTDAVDAMAASALD